MAPPCLPNQLRQHSGRSLDLCVRTVQIPAVSKQEATQVMGVPPAFVSRVSNEGVLRTGGAHTPAHSGNS
eukprot:2274336-Heterocapsa_arctica.AAC.1